MHDHCHYIFLHLSTKCLLLLLKSGGDKPNFEISQQKYDASSVDLKKRRERIITSLDTQLSMVADAVPALDNMRTQHCYMTKREANAMRGSLQPAKQAPITCLSAVSS
jgi:hypothetical protein